MMAFPPAELMHDSRLLYAAKLYAVALWWPVGPQDREPRNWQSVESLADKAGLSRSTAFRSKRQLVTAGWIVESKERHPATGSMAKIARLQFSPAHGTPPCHPRDIPHTGLDSPADDTGQSHPRDAEVPHMTPIGKRGKGDGIDPPTTPLPPTIVIREQVPPTVAAKAADHFFFELEQARRSLAPELGDSWTRIRSARLKANLAEHHDNLAFAVDAEGLETVTAVVSWGWCQAAAGKREVGHQCGTFSGGGGAWRRLLEAYRSAHGKGPTSRPEVDGIPLVEDDEIAVWREWSPTSHHLACERIRDMRADKRRMGHG